MSSNTQDILSDIGEPCVRIMAMPKNTNWLGDIFGGWLMSHADMAGAVLAYRRASGKVVTVAVDQFEFRQPVYTGDVVTFFSRIVKVGNTSLRVGVEMYAERPGTESKDQIHVASAEITYVHVGDNRKPKSVSHRDDDNPGA